MVDTGVNKKLPYFGEPVGLTCSESTLRYLIEQGTIDLPLDSVKLMTGLHGGMGRCAKCGAVNAGVVALGSKFGRVEPEEVDELYRCMSITEEFLKAFETKFGTLNCKELVGNRVTGDMAVMKECADYVLEAAKMVEELISKHDTKAGV